MGNWEFHILKFPAQSINVDKQGTTSKTIWQPKKKCERERDIIVYQIDTAKTKRIILVR